MKLKTLGKMFVLCILEILRNIVGFTGGTIACVISGLSYLLTYFGVPLMANAQEFFINMEKRVKQW